MKKIFRAAAIIIIPVLIFILLWYKEDIADMFYVNAEMHINNYFSFESKNKVTEFHGEYYYATPAGVYLKDGGQIISANSEPLIYSDEESVYLYFPESGEVSVYNSDLILQDTYSVVKNCRGFCVADGYALLIDEGSLSIYNTADFSSVNMTELGVETIVNEFFSEKFTYKYIELSDSSSIVFNDGISAFSLYDKRADATVYTFHSDDSFLPLKYDSGYVSIGNTTNSRLEILWREKDSGGQFAGRECVTQGCGYSGGIYYSIGQSTKDRERFEDKHEPTDNTLLNYQSAILIGDTASGKMLADEWLDETHGRIIYADSEKLIVYSVSWGGQYITYSISEHKVTDKQKAGEIKDGGSYTFETCGEYIFVFDDNTGELVNTISVA